MNPEHWKQIERLYHAALEREPDARATFLNEACAGDEELRLEVAALLAYDGSPASFIEAPALEVAARELVGQALSGARTQAMASPPQISGYQLLAPLGRGGMGEVHLALDTRLNRKVAIKLLPAEFTAQPERVRRFAQEARAASALNHPNIITIHEIGEAGDTHYIVTEYVAGETLRQRLMDAPHHQLQIAEAVDVAAQIAAALAAAHEAGITHRDIKPENVMVRRDGILKVLDFGLAKLAEPSSPAVDTQAPPAPGVSTEAGVVMGTPRYMSPEQARGLKVDTRTDIFSLGVMLYEMVAGRAPFAGATASEVIAAILRDAPPSPRALNPDLPVELEHLISKALEKDRDLRCQSAQEMLADLKRLQRDLASGRAASMQPVASAPTNATRSPARWRKWAVIGAVPFVMLAGLLFWQWRRPLEPPKVTNYTPVTTDGTVFDSPTPSWIMTMVTDGPRLYYSVVSKGRVILNQISGAGGEAATLPTPFQNALLMDISPSRSELLLVNFTVATELEAPLWILPIPGGSPRRLGDVQAHAAAWSPNGQQIVYANGSELFLADSNGAGAHKLLLVEGRPYWLRWSPDGARLRFSVRRNQLSDVSLWEVNADGTNPHPLLPGWPGQNAPTALCCGNWTADGKYFVFQATRHPLVSLWALREDAGSEPVQLTFGPLNFRAPVPSADGRQLFAVGERQRGELVRYDKQTEQWVSYLSGMSAHMLSFSGDGEWMAYVAYPEGSLWRSRMDGTERLQLTFPPMQVYVPRWSPDGKRIAFMAMLPGKSQRIYVVAADGGAPQQLTPEEHSANDPSWSPDGATLAFTSASTPEERAIYLLDLRTGQISPLPSNESIFSPRWSPDGRSIAAMSRNGGKLLLFDLTTKQWTQLTDLNVSYPQWSRDGKYIYFANRLHNNSALMRLRLSDRQLERWASLKDLRLASASFGSWMGLAPDDSPLMLRDVGPQDIYALEWKAP